MTNNGRDGDSPNFVVDTAVAQPVAILSQSTRVSPLVTGAHVVTDFVCIPEPGGEEGTQWKIEESTRLTCSPDMSIGME